MFLLVWKQKIRTECRGRTNLKSDMQSRKGEYFIINKIIVHLKLNRNRTNSLYYVILSYGKIFLKNVKFEYG